MPSRLLRGEPPCPGRVDPRMIDGMAEQWEVATKDGGSIAVWVDGTGPPLVLVHGSMCDHSTFRPLIGELRDERTIFAMDRRGFGASPDPPGYSADREFADVATVVAAVADRTGRPAAVLGHSWGASCALGAATQAAGLGALVLYEPSLGLRYPAGSIDRIEQRVAEGDHEGAVLEVLVGIAGMTDEEVAGVRAAPTWPDRIATAPTIARESRIEDGWVWDAQRFSSIAVPTLLLSGSQSPRELTGVTERTAAAIPGARIHVLAGHGHFAYRFAPEVVAHVLREWLP